MKFKVGEAVNHDTYGRGIVIDAWRSPRGSENYAIRFDTGGPQGFAQNSTNDVDDLRTYDA